MTLQEIDDKIKATIGLGGMTGNERLFVSGLMDEFDYCKKQDKEKARYILRKLGFDNNSIDKITE